MTERNIIDNTNSYYMVQLNMAIYHYEKREFAQVEFIRAELRSCNMLLLWQNLIDRAEFNNIELFVKEMLGGKTDNGIGYKRN